MKLFDLCWIKQGLLYTHTILYTYLQGFLAIWHRKCEVPNLWHKIFITGFRQGTKWKILLTDLTNRLYLVGTDELAPVYRIYKTCRLLFRTFLAVVKHACTGRYFTLMTVLKCIFKWTAWYLCVEYVTGLSLNSAALTLCPFNWLVRNTCAHLEELTEVKSDRILSSPGKEWECLLNDQIVLWMCFRLVSLSCQV